MILTILKYLGLLLAAASSIWGTTHELTFKTADNHKRLTKAGFISMIFIIAGLILSIISDDIGRRKAAEEQFAKAAAEAKRTNEIIIASQPLTSLNLVLQFESSDTVFRGEMEEAEIAIQKNVLSEQGGVPKVPFEYMEYEHGLRPMLKFLAQFGDHTLKYPEVYHDDEKNGNADSSSIVALIPLDGSLNSILFFGDVRGQAAWDDYDTTNKAPGSISPNHSDVTAPLTGRKISVDSPSTYSISWNLDPVTLESSLHRTNTSIRAAAKLPQVINLVMLRIPGTLRFEKDGFALSSNSAVLYSDQIKDTLSKVPNMTLSATVNGFSEFEYHYKLNRVYNTPVYDNFGEEIDVRRTILEFRLN